MFRGKACDELQWMKMNEHRYGYDLSFIFPEVNRVDILNLCGNPYQTS